MVVVGGGGGGLLLKGSILLSSSSPTSTSASASAALTLNHCRRAPLLALHQYLLLQQQPQQPIPYHSTPNCGRTRSRRRCLGSINTTVAAATPSSFPVISHPRHSYVRPSNPTTRNVKKKIMGFCTSTTSTTTTTTASAQQDEKNNNDKIKEAANTLDIRVGKILLAYKHPEADSLFVEEVDVGEPQPRIICSGLVNYIPINDLMLLKVVVLTNLKPRNMRGVRSYGMLLAASDADHENVELLMPPENSVPGDRIWFGSTDEKDSLPDVASPNQIQKKKIWELVQLHLKTDDSCVAALGLHTMQTVGGAVVAKSLKNARIS